MGNNNGSNVVGSLGEGSPVGHLPLALLPLLHLRKTHTVQDGDDDDDDGDGDNSDVDDDSGDDDCTFTKHTLSRKVMLVMTIAPS